MTRSLLAQWSQIQRKLAGLSEHLLESHAAGAWSPNTDVFEGPDDIVVKMELAGVSKNSIQVHLEDQAVIVDGIREDPAGGESAAGYRFVQMEIEYGPFRRVVPLPYAVDGNHAAARIENGILKIRLPRARTLAPSSITVIMES